MLPIMLHDINDNCAKYYVLPPFTGKLSNLHTFQTVVDFFITFLCQRNPTEELPKNFK